MSLHEIFLFFVVLEQMEPAAENYSLSPTVGATKGLLLSPHFKLVAART